MGEWLGESDQQTLYVVEHQKFPNGDVSGAAGCDLADRAIALLAEVTGQASHGCEPTPSTPAAVSLMRSALAESPHTQTTQAHSAAAAASQPRSGPAR